MGTGIGNVIVGGSTIKGGVEDNNGFQVAQGATATAHQGLDTVVTTAENLKHYGTPDLPKGAQPAPKSVAGKWVVGPIGAGVAGWGAINDWNSINNKVEKAKEEGKEGYQAFGSVPASSVLSISGNTLGFISGAALAVVFFGGAATAPVWVPITTAAGVAVSVASAAVNYFFPNLTVDDIVSGRYISDFFDGEFMSNLLNKWLEINGIDNNLPPTLPKKHWFDDGHQCVSTWLSIDRSGTYFIYDPLVLDLNGDGIQTTAIDRDKASNNAYFDFDNDGRLSVVNDELFLMAG